MIRWILIMARIVSIALVVATCLLNIRELYFICFILNSLFLFIVHGLWKKKRWVILPEIAVIILATLVALFAMAGNIAWPEGIIFSIVLGYLVLMIIELITIVFVLSDFGRNTDLPEAKPSVSS